MATENGISRNMQQQHFGSWSSEHIRFLGSCYISLNSVEVNVIHRLKLMGLLV